MKRFVTGLVATALLVACTDGFFFEPDTAPAGFTITFDLTPLRQYTSADLGSTFDKVDRARIVLRDSEEQVVADESTSFDPSSPTVEVPLDFDIPAEGATYGLTGELYVGMELIYSGSTTVRISPAGSTSAEIPILPISVEIQSPDTVRFDALTDTVEVPVYGIFANGDSIPGVGIAWTVLDPAIASATSAGTFVSHAEGSTLAVARSGDQVDTTTVVVAPVVTEVEVQPDVVSADVDVDVQFTATAMDRRGNALERSTAWSVDNTNVATIDQNGLLVTQGEGTAEVTAEVEGVTGTAQITVTRVILPVVSVTVEPSSREILVGETVGLTAVARDANGSVLLGRTTTWSSGNTGIARVSTAGVVTGVALGDVEITATVENISATATISVVEPGVATVTIAPPEAELVVGQTRAFTATAQDADGNVLEGRTVTWSSSNTSAATISAAGVVTAVAPGSSTIEAVVDGVSATAAVTVIPVAVASVTVTPSAANVVIGATQALTATARDASGNVLTGRTVTWSSLNTSVATVSTSGVVTGVALGTATIQALVDGVAGTSAITVVEVPVGSVEVTPEAATVLVSQTQQLTATVRDGNGNVLEGRTVTWSSGTPSVATVDANGLVTAVSGGTAVISATSGGESGQATITVPTPTPVAGGTFNQGDDGEGGPVGTAFLFDPSNDVDPGSPVSSVTISGPAGWNASESLECLPIYEETGHISADRAFCLTDADPVSGAYTGTSTLGSTDFSVDAASLLPRPVISSMASAGTDEIAVWWEGDASHGSYVIRVYDAETGTTVAQGVVPGDWRSVALFATLTPSTDYAAVVIALSEDVTAEGEPFPTTFRAAESDPLNYITPAGQQLWVSGYDDASMTVFRQPTFSVLGTDTPPGAVNLADVIISFSDVAMAADAGDPGVIYLFDVFGYEAFSSASVGTAVEWLVENPYRAEIYAGGAGGYIHVMDDFYFEEIDAVDVAGAIGGMAVSHDGSKIYATTDDDLVAIMDADTRTITTVKVGAGPTGVAATADYVFVANGGDGTVTVLDAGTHELVTTITVGANPADVVVAPIGTYVLVANRGSGTVSVIRIENLAVEDTIQVGSEPVQIAFAKEEHLVYVTNYGDGTVSVISTLTHDVLSVLQKPGAWGVAVRYSDGATYSPPPTSLQGAAGVAPLRSRSLRPPN
ncbi:MAG TPA: Ig-like domain-containing protein [Longimicrobiales bacterium]|nr:Ig-like domain-containing protein [Longimicrobiales bacterium]